MVRPWDQMGRCSMSTDPAEGILRSDWDKLKLSPFGPGTKWVDRPVTERISRCCQGLLAMGVVRLKSHSLSRRS
jgi:hypothetical protein